MKNILIIFILLLPLSTKAQHRNDYNWMIGYGPLIPESKVGGTKIDFSTDPPTQSYYPVPEDLIACSGMISDSAGILQFYTNGCEVFDTTHHIMKGGDSLNYPGYLYNYFCAKSAFNYDYGSLNGLMVLPVPNTLKKYMIFHVWYGETDVYDLTYPVALLYTMVDMNANNGLGAVVVKNQALIHDTIGDMMAAVKHGNGRDWWIVNPKINSDLMTLMLLTPEGIKGPFYQPTGVYWPVKHNIFQVSGGVFSPSGSKYAKACTREDRDLPGKLQVCDFDRCTGTFSCPKTYEFPIEEEVSVTDVAFSPNGRFVYVTTNLKIYQFDTSEKDLGSTRILVGEHDGFKAPIETTLYQMQLAPNGKIYVCASNGAHVLHTIHNPNEKGLACGFVNHDFDLLTMNGFVLPNFPNFRLYDWQGSPCDNLGINAPNDSLLVLWAGHETIRMSPNPANQFTLMTAPTCKDGTITVFDAIGRLVYEQKGVRSGKNYELDVSDWPAGVYFAVVRDGTRAKVTASRLVVVH